MASRMSKKTRLIIIAIVIVVVAAIVGIVLSRGSGDSSESTLQSQKAPDFTLPTMTGANITLSELEGTPMVLVFWTRNCPHCNVELHLLEDAIQQSEGEINVIAANVGESASSVQAFFGDYEPTMVVALDEDREVFMNYSQKDNPRGYVPITFFVDSEGLVQYIKIGAFTSEAQLWDTLNDVFGTPIP